MLRTNLLFSFIISIFCAVALTNCASSQNRESTGQFLDSSAVTVKVKANLLSDKLVKSSPITVKTYKGAVELSGFVDNQAQKSRAVDIARRVNGVVSVTDALVIKHN